MSTRPATRRLGNKRRRLLMTIAEHALLICIAIIMLFPLVAVVGTALMTPQQALTGSVVPHPVRWENFVDVFRAVPLARYYLNTIVIAVTSMLAMLASAVPAAYALSCLRIPGKRIFVILIVAAMMLPGQVTVIPMYVLWAHLHLVGTPLPLILPNLFLDAFSVFLLRQFFVSVPASYIEAARIDGAGEVRTLLNVFLPLVKSGIAAVCLFSFFYSWNDYFNPLLYLGDNQDWYTLSIALANFHSTHGVDWSLTMAATLLFVAPVLVLFFLAQRAFIQGISLTGVKG